jgi:hypothetical protein
MILKSGTRSLTCRGAVTALVVAAGFARPAAAQFKKDLPPVTCATVESIGTAQMATDGTITLHLQSLWPDPKENTDLAYAPDDPQYDDIKKHLGGIEPGQSKPIPPFC